MVPKRTISGKAAMAACEWNPHRDVERDGGVVHADAHDERRPDIAIDSKLRSVIPPGDLWKSTSGHSARTKPVGVVVSGASSVLSRSRI